MGPIDDHRLILRAQSGDLVAFEQLLRAIEPALRRYVVRLVGGRGVAEDILQETFLRVWRGIRWLDEPAFFRAWAYRIATRETHRFMRREHKHEEKRGDESELEMLEAPFADPAQLLDLESTLARITPLARIVLVAHFLEGLTLAEVAAATQAPLGTVKSRLASGLRQARALMEAAA